MTLGFEAAISIFPSSSFYDIMYIFFIDLSFNFARRITNTRVWVCLCV